MATASGCTTAQVVSRMSSDERDAAVWEAVGGDADELAVDGKDADDDTEYVTREEYDELQEEVHQLRDTVKRLVRQINNQRGDGFEGLNTLEKYTRMVENGDDESLSASDRRAVAIHRNWDAIAERMANGNLGVSTKKRSAKAHGPSQLKVDLQNILGEDLQNTQIYRAMKRAAKLSGGTAEPNEYGRTKIVGGIYEYHERTSPDNTDHTTYKVLIET